MINDLMIWLCGVVFSAGVAYGAVRGEIAKLEERERNHFDEIIRRLARIEGKVS